MAISGEQERLAMIRRILQAQPVFSPPIDASVQLAVGTQDADDCAVYDLSGDVSLVVGMDFIRGTQFALFQENYLNYFDIGYYLIAANLSDIAAMGAAPIGLTTIIRYPALMEDATFTAIVQGTEEAAKQFHTPIIGGDIGGYTEVVLAATALGVVERGMYLRRKGTVEGDLLCVTGQIGLPSTALAYFLKAKKGGFALSAEEEKGLLRSWQRPIPRVVEGRALAKLGLVHACQDISDGLKATIDQLGYASNVSFEIHEAALPLHPTTFKVAHFLRADSAALALSASVDFQLLFTISPSALEKVREVLWPDSQPYVLGHAISGSASSRFVRSDGRVSPLPGTPWDQQTGAVANVILENC